MIYSLPFHSRREIWNLVCQALRAVVLFTAGIYACFSVQLHVHSKHSPDEERRSLLDNPSEATNAYGSLHVENPDDTNDENNNDNDSNGSDDDEDEDEDDKEMKKLQKQRITEQGGWFGYLKGFLIFLPYVLPYKDRITQLWMLVMLVGIAAERVLTLMIPRQLGVVTEALTNVGTTGKYD